MILWSFNFFHPLPKELGFFFNNYYYILFILNTFYLELNKRIYLCHSQYFTSRVEDAKSINIKVTQIHY